MRLIRCFSFGKVSNSRALEILKDVLDMEKTGNIPAGLKAEETYISQMKKELFGSAGKCSGMCYYPIFDSQIYQNTAESLILPGFFSGAFSFYYIVFFLNQIWMIDFYDFSRDCLLSFWISFIFLLVRNS